MVAVTLTELPFREGINHADTYIILFVKRNNTLSDILNTFVHFMYLSIYLFKVESSKVFFFLFKSDDLNIEFSPSLSLKIYRLS